MPQREAERQGSEQLAKLVINEQDLRNQTVEQAAELMGVSVGTLVNIRQRRASPSLQTWARCAKYLGVTVETLKEHCYAIDEGVPEHDAPVLREAVGGRVA